MRRNSGSGHYQSAQTQDKSLEEVDISLSGTKHSPQQWWLSAGGMLGGNAVSGLTA